jgi:hypothetical protein
MKEGGKEEKREKRSVPSYFAGVCNRLVALLNKTTITHIPHSVVHEYVQKSNVRHIESFKRNAVVFL